MALTLEIPLDPTGSHSIPPLSFPAKVALPKSNRSRRVQTAIAQQNESQDVASRGLGGITSLPSGRSNLRELRKQPNPGSMSSGAFVAL